MKKCNLRRKVSSMAVSAAMVLSLIGTSSVTALAEGTMTADDCYAEGYDVNVQLEAEGAVLLKNKENCLPLAEGTKVTVLGAMSYNYVEGGTGSAGGKDDENTVMMNDAFAEAGLDVNADGWSWLEDQCGGTRNDAASDPGGAGAGGDDMFGSSAKASFIITVFSSSLPPADPVPPST